MSNLKIMLVMDKTSQLEQIFSPEFKVRALFKCDQVLADLDSMCRIV